MLVLGIAWGLLGGSSLLWWQHTVSLYIWVWFVVGLVLFLPTYTIRVYAPLELSDEIALTRWLMIGFLGIIAAIGLLPVRHRLPQLILSGISFSFTLIILEAAVRLYIGLNPIYYQLVFVPDANIGWRQAPNIEYEWAGLDPLCVDFRNQVVINPEGFYDAEHSLETDKTRFAFLGDSLVMSREVPQAERFSNLVGERLVNTETLNFGVSGFSIGQYVPLYETYVASYQPDRVFVLVSEIQMVRTANPTTSLQASSISETTYRLRPFFMINEFDELEYMPPQDVDIFESIVESSDPEPQLITEPPNDQWGTVGIISSPYAWGVSHSRLMYLVHNRWRFFQRGLYDVMSSAPQQANNYAIEALDLRLQFAVLEQLQVLVESDGADLILLDLSENAELQTRVADFAEAQSLGYINLNEDVQSQIASGETMYFPCDGHFTVAGHQVVASTIVEALDQ